MYRSWSVPTNQTQEECLSDVNHARVHAAPPPIARTAVQAKDCQCAAGVLMVEKQLNVTGKLPISRVAPAHEKQRQILTDRGRRG
ncbi:hypothetical protein ILYODFUR_037988 [Ilyodon furcidens]|uniref:Uncharacterized protein n=1 Tax=Ilyodon furcidens TaxID=33524 RepID=A0ABV0UR38_9TELE